MNYRKATATDATFIEQLMLEATTDEKRALGYPCWDLTDNLKDINQRLEDVMLIAKDLHQPVGVAGIFDASWGTYFIGPIFIESHHTQENYEDFLAKILAQNPDFSKKLAVDTKGSNLVLKQALENSGFNVTYAGVSMFYDLTTHVQMEIPAEIVEITVKHGDFIQQINELFTAYLVPWQGKGENDLRERLADGMRVAVVTEEKKVVGAVVWEFADGSGEIEYLCVDERYQGKGYGRMLLTNCKNLMACELSTEAENRIYLDVAQKNQVAQDFYRSQGFQVEYLRQVYRMGK